MLTLRLGDGKAGPIALFVRGDMHQSILEANLLEMLHRLKCLKIQTQRGMDQLDP
jgi:hypothetical protein